MDFAGSIRARVFWNALIAFVPFFVALALVWTSLSGIPALVTIALLTFVTTIVVSYRIYRIYTRPLEDLTIAMREVSETQDLGLRLTSDHSIEVTKLADAFNQLLDRIAVQEEALSRFNEELCTLVDQQTVSLRNQRDYVNRILEFMMEGLFVTDTTGHITTTNPSALTMTGYNAEELHGRFFESLFAGPNSGTQGGMIRQIQREGTITNHERRILTHSGGAIPVLVSASLMTDLHGNALGIVCVLLDITERKQFEKVLFAARDEAIAADKLKSEFLATTSHEIRTPMNGVIGLTSLLLETELNEEQREFADAINSCGQSLLRIINDILDFSKIEAGRMQIDSVDFNVSRLVEDVAELFWAKAKEKGFEIVPKIGQKLPRWVIGDSNRIRQILSNLVSNAVKFTDIGGVSLGVSLQEETESHYILRFAVKDTGIGIREEGKDRLFEPFFQVDSSYSRSYGGTGLGLAISKKLVTLMNGTIGVESVAGKGSEFWFVVPLQKPEAKYERVNLGSSPFGGRIALIAASDDNLRESMRMQLQSWGVSVHEAATSIETLVLLKDADVRKRDYDIIVVDEDIEYKGEPLVNFLIKKHPVHASALGIITQQGNNSTYLEEESSIHAVLTKPIGEQQLFDCFSRLE